MVLPSRFKTRSGKIELVGLVESCLFSSPSRGTVERRP